ncbi:hypothetical protein BH09ACT12_BH09ACT12_26040 [soil metagenome]
MRRTLGTSLALTLLCAALLSGCSGDDEVLRPADATGSDPAASSTPGDEPTETPTSTQTDGDAAEPVDYDVVALINANGARGGSQPMLTPVDTPEALDAFATQFDVDGLADEIRSQASTSYDGQLWGGVVSGGCDVPTDVFVEEGEAGYLVTARKAADPIPECLVAVTTVVLVAIR